ncbi:MAG: hypothetical protein ACLGHN_09655 [Bacteriovoracia bacterium]
MDKFTFGKKILTQLLVMIFIISGCMPADVPSAQTAAQAGKNGKVTSGSGAGAEDPDLGNGTSLPPKVEIRHLIEPNLSTDTSYSTGTGVAGGGSYVRKITLPKNFAGRLYLAGINIGSLADRHVKVRFKFGVNREAVTIPATVTRAPGITPQTDISVLVMDLRSEPFRNIRLPYDLFDYNEYAFDPDGTFADGVEPVQDNRNTGLYCRGLRIEDDPTFQGVGACDGLQSTTGQPDEECLYAYAKVLDQGLVQLSGSVKVPITPSFPQIKSVTGSNYFMDYMSQKLLKPLPDTMSLTAPNVAGSFSFSTLAVPANSTDSIDVNFVYPTSIWDPVTILGTQYYYRGPYRLVNRPNWEFDFPFDQIHGKNRLFRENSWVDYPLYLTNPLPDDYPVQPFPLPQPEQYRLYYNSYLFPLATKLDLTANVTHLASNDADGVRTEQTLPVAGKTMWMDGANARAQSRNYDLEHIGSCNVSATIEIIAKDDNNVDYVISLSKDVKLQLVRPSQYRTDTGNEVLYTNFKSCTENAGCGSSECCFNNRCWDQSLVSQCLDSSSTQGNRIIGESCTSDLECSSLCCNRTSGECAPHNTITSPAVLCSKPIGDYCIAKEWCQKTTVVKCLVVRTGTDNLGNTTCRQHCYNVEEYGDCKNGVCVAPEQEPIPPFDPNDPDACLNAVPAPNF